MTAADKPKRTDRLSTAQAQDLNPGSLVGSFFHSGAEPGWQGCVVVETAPTVYLVETFDWFTGMGSVQSLVPLADMTEWRFYDDADWMRNAYEHGVATRWERARADQTGGTRT